MPDPHQDDMPTTRVGYEDDDFDVSLSYSVLEGDMDDYDTLVNSSRTIEATIIEERDEEIEVELEVTDNTNKGVFALGGISENHPGGDYEQFTETLVFDKTDIPYYQDDFPNVQSHIPIGERIIPVLKDWSKSEPFRA